MAGYSGYSREIAKRVFANELSNSNLTFKEGDDDFSPKYLLTPTGAKCNRIYFVGSLIEIDNVGKENDNWRGRIVDPTGRILIFAHQKFQPKAAQVLSQISVPTFVAVIGKPSVYEVDGRAITTVRAELVEEVDDITRDRWILETSKQTIERIKLIKTSHQDVANRPVESFQTGEQFKRQEALNPKMESDAEKAILHYSTNIEEYSQMVLSALESLQSDIANKKSQDGHIEISERKSANQMSAPSIPHEEKSDIEEVVEIDMTAHRTAKHKQRQIG